MTKKENLPSTDYFDMPAYNMSLASRLCWSSRRFEVKIKTVFFFSFITLSISAKSQEWQNPSEKYKDAYKKYESTACPIPKDNIQNFVYFARDRQSIMYCVVFRENNKATGYKK